MNYTLDEAVSLINKKTNKQITTRQIRDLAINGEVALCFLYRGTAYNCDKEKDEEIYGYPIIFPAYITELEMKGSQLANMFFFNNSLYKVLSPNFAVALTKDNLLIHETYVNKLIGLNLSDEPKTEPKHVKLQVKQEMLILQAIEQLGFDRFKLAKNAQGKAGIKKRVKDYVTCSNKTYFQGDSVFGKAWQRLLDKKDITYTD